MTGLRNMSNQKKQERLVCLRLHFDALAMFVMAQQARHLVKRRCCQYCMDVWVVAVARSIILGRAGYALYTLAGHRHLAWWWQMTFLPKEPLAKRWTVLRRRAHREEMARLLGRWLSYLDHLEATPRQRDSAHPSRRRPCVTSRNVCVAGSAICLGSSRGGASAMANRASLALLEQESG